MFRGAAARPSPQTRLRPSITELPPHHLGSASRARRIREHSRNISQRQFGDDPASAWLLFIARCCERRARRRKKHSLAGWKTCPTTTSKLDLVPLGHRPADRRRHVIDLLEIADVLRHPRDGGLLAHLLVIEVVVVDRDDTVTITIAVADAVAKIRVYGVIRRL